MQRRSGGGGTHMIARLKPGATITEAQFQIDVHNTDVEKDNPDAKMMAEAAFRSPVLPFHADHVRSIRPTLLLMQGGIFFLLLIGAVNLVNLLLIRASRCAKEMAMGKRRAARRAALQYHCWRDLHHGAGPKTIEELCPAKNNVRLFVRPLIEGMLTHLSEIDERITRYCENYEFRRLSAVDRNVLRLGIFEMFYRDDIPPVVWINEAIES